MKRHIATLLLFAVLLPALVGGGVFGVAAQAQAETTAAAKNVLEKYGVSTYVGLRNKINSGKLEDKVIDEYLVASGFKSREETKREDAERVHQANPCGLDLMSGCILKFFFFSVINELYFIVLQIFTLFFNLVIWIVTYNNFLNSPVVEVGWVLVRDVANLFFILILLIIAFSTILGVEKMSYKQHLFKLLLMAIVINFSKMITGLMIDFSQVVMLTFANALSGKGSFLGNMGISKLNSFNDDVPIANFFGLLLNTIFGMLIIIFAAVVVGVIFVMLLARILMLWILTALSPLAFLLSAFPQGQQYAGKWWGELSKNLVGGPVLVFFLWLALSVQGNIQELFSGLADPATGVRLRVGLSAMGTSDSLVTFAVSIGLLIAGLKFAQESGAAGASVAGAALEKGKKFGNELKSGAYRETIGTVIQKYRESDFAKRHPRLDVTSRWKARKEYKEGLQKTAEEGALAHAKQFVEEKATVGRIKKPYAEAHEAKIEREYAENFKGRNKDDMAAQGNALLGLRTVKIKQINKETGQEEEVFKTILDKEEVLRPEERRARRGLAATQGEEGYVDDQMAAIATDQDGDDDKMKAFRKQFRATYLKNGYNQRAAGKFLQDFIGSKDGFRANMQKRVDITERLTRENNAKPPDQRLSKKNLEKNIENEYKKDFHADSDGQRTIYQINDIAKKNTHAQLMGNSATDPTGKRKALFGEEAERQAIIEASKFKNSRETAGNAPHAYGSIDLQTGRYRKDAGDFGREMLTFGYKGKDQAFIGQWAQARVANMMMGGTADKSTWDEESGTMDLREGGAAGMMQDAAKIDKNILGAMWVKAGGTKGEGTGAVADENTIKRMRFKVNVDKETNAILTDDDIADREGKEVGDITDEDRKKHSVEKIVDFEAIKEGKFIEPPPLPTPPASSKSKTSEQKISSTSEPPASPAPGTSPTQPPAPSSTPPKPSAPGSPQIPPGTSPTPPPAPEIPKTPSSTPTFPTAEFDKLTKAIEGLGVGMKDVGSKIEKIDVTSGLQTVFQKFGSQLDNMNFKSVQGMATLAKAMRNRIKEDEAKKGTSTPPSASGASPEQLESD